MERHLLSDQFLLRKDITFLNFGSFGASPRPVFERYQQYQLELEQEPVEFITNTGLHYLKESRNALAKFVGCAADDLVYVVNPSYAVNIVAKNYPLQSGDEVLTTAIEYGACDKTWNYYCKKVGAKYVKQPITFPLTTKEKFVEDFFKGLTAKTKIIFISHITSSTALRLPVEEICAIAKEKGLVTIVDGAHAPAQIDLDFNTLQADVYVGACHKWMMAPKGASFLYVKKEFQHLFDPLVISWGYDALFPSSSQFLDYHQAQGTRDFSAFLTVPTAINFMEENDWKTVAKNCRQLTIDNVNKFATLLNTEPLTHNTDDFTVQMCSTKIKTTEPEKLHNHLFEKYKIQVPIMRLDDSVFVRYSIQVFNTQNDLDTLCNALADITKNTHLIEI
jgi:isopenicillin-N epimerase